MSDDPALDENVRQAIEMLQKASERGAAEQRSLQALLDGIESQLDNLPTLPPLPEALADGDWSSPWDNDGPPDGSGGDGGSGSSDGGPGPADAASAAAPVDDGTLASIIQAPITVGRALLTLALPAAILGGLAGAGGVTLGASQEGPPPAVAQESGATFREASTDSELEARREARETVDAIPAPSPAVAEVTAGSPAADSAAPEHEAAPARDTLAQESRLVDGARTALSHRDVASCRSFVAQHRTRFPRGALAEERDALDVRCRRLAGDPTVEAAAHAFRERFPRSLQPGVSE